MASCYLLTMADDSIEGIFETLRRCAIISKNAGGIGLAVSCIRANGSYIEGVSIERFSNSSFTTRFSRRTADPMVCYQCCVCSTMFLDMSIKVDFPIVRTNFSNRLLLVLGGKRPGII